MTAAHPIAYPMMDVPSMDDSMEMASPYQGQADDFDIDIDLMEDSVSNMDSEMMGADEFTNTSQPIEPNNDAIYDADMADEPSEGSMIDADNYVDEDNDIDVQLEEETYQEEMIESDSIEEINQAVPATHVEPTRNNEGAASPIRADPTIATAELPEAAPQDPNDFVEISPIQDESQASNVEISRNLAESSTVEDDLAEEPSEITSDTKTGVHHEKPELGKEANEMPQPSVSETEAKDISDKGLETSQVETPTQESKVDATGHPEAPLVSEGNHQVATHDDSVHQIPYMDQRLHPVKILYQNCEIALFPPLEGDSAETYFLQDEDVAYDNIGQLFKHLRQVLEETLGNDVLVIDIDTLGIQMTEDSSHTSRVTLYQILDLYLRLCRNDGTNEPDALYLTLSSRRAFSDEILDLSAAAIAGKTLSELQAEIHSWNEYDEPEPGSEDFEAHCAEEHEDEVYYANEAQKDHATTEVQTTPGPTADVSPSSVSQVQPQDVSDTQTKIAHAPDEDASVSSERATEAMPESELAHPATQAEIKEPGQPEESEHLEIEQAHQYDYVHGDTTEDHYDSEGPQGPHSESTATISGFIVENETKENTQDVSPDAAHAGPSGADQTDHENFYEEEPENDDLGPEEYYEDENPDSLDDPEASHNDITGVEDDNVETQESADQAHVLDEEDEDELDAPPTNEIVSATSLQHETTDHPHDQTGPLSDSGLQADSDKKDRTPEPADDLLEIAEDLLQTPPRDTEPDDLDHFKDIDYEESEDELAAPVAGDDEGVHDHEFDENHFGDYDTHFEEPEAAELVEVDHSLTDSPNQNSSTKRSREDDEHSDVVPTTTDTKRRRSS
ncbi:hypothetical protein N7457_009831 [Penicillium paradoxum]|uniref:uncharacterized protein n=1 Tax=Penicillium paradoxum TaxID=176176 RepID=UPI002546C7A3|nr:uncharacterized protein N7457_009831 [Penicillium paradoxum]KAJ5774935.1 hypothetical protein N7457_009831 [Penicillium paradoxum]